MIDCSIVIPTRNRENDLRNCINSICKQSYKPLEVLVIDDGNMLETYIKKINNELTEKGIIFKYFKKDKPGQSESKNLGAKNSKGQVILFLDDDVILEDKYIENILKIWEEKWNDEKLAGVSGVSINSKKKSTLKKIFDRIFFLYSSKTWSILPWGFQTWDFHINKDEKSDWMPAGMCSFRKEIFENYNYKQFQSNRTSLEDVELCWQIKDKGYYFIVTPSAKLFHNESPAGREKIFYTGLKEIINRRAIFKMHSEKTFKNYFGFYMANTGCILAAFLGGHFKKGLGMLKGYFNKIQ